jgi:TPP-dependent pyruvate/acetoin dehydrogenase alpha subunit
MTREHVYVFVGDMASKMGQFYEAVKYAEGEDLPITFIVEDNELGCNTPTKEVWKKEEIIKSSKVIYYTYKRKYPHYGIGEWIIFNDKKTKGVGDYNAYK